MRSVVVTASVVLLFISIMSPAAEPGRVSRIKYDRLLEMSGGVDPWTRIAKAYKGGEIIVLLFSSHRDECAKFFHNQADLARVAEGTKENDAKNVAIIDIDTTRLSDQPSLAKWHKTFSDDLPGYSREAFGTYPDPLLVLMDTNLKGYPRVAPLRHAHEGSDGKNSDEWKKTMDASDKYILAILRDYGHRLDKTTQLEATKDATSKSQGYERLAKALAKVEGSRISCLDRIIAYWKGQEQDWREHGQAIEEAIKRLER